MWFNCKILRPGVVTVFAGRPFMQTPRIRCFYTQCDPHALKIDCILFVFYSYVLVLYLYVARLLLAWCFSHNHFKRIYTVELATCPQTSKQGFELRSILHFRIAIFVPPIVSKCQIRYYVYPFTVRTVSLKIFTITVDSTENTAKSRQLLMRNLVERRI